MVRLTDRLDMALDVYRGRKTTMQQQRLRAKMLLHVLVGWLLGFNGPLRQYSVYIGPSPREREREKKSER